MIKWTGPTGLAQTWPGPNRLDLVEPGKTPARPLSLATPLTRTHTVTALTFLLPLVHHASAAAPLAPGRSWPTPAPAIWGFAPPRCSLPPPIDRFIPRGFNQPPPIREP
jgi:hypothetical protein